MHVCSWWRWTLSHCGNECPVDESIVTDFLTERGWALHSARLEVTSLSPVEWIRALDVLPWLHQVKLRNEWPACSNGDVAHRSLHFWEKTPHSMGFVVEAESQLLPSAGARLLPFCPSAHLATSFTTSSAWLLKAFPACSPWKTFPPSPHFSVLCNRRVNGDLRRAVICTMSHPARQGLEPGLRLPAPHKQLASPEELASLLPEMQFNWPCTYTFKGEIIYLL